MDQEFRNQFFGLLEASSSFKLLSPEQQTSVRAKYENATDEELKEGIQALEEDKIFTANLEAEEKKNQEELEKKVSEVKGVMKTVKRDKLRNDEAADNQASEKEMAGVLQQIDTMGIPKNDPPKKKVLGLF